MSGRTNSGYRNQHPVDRYRRWWVGKYCRLAGSDKEFQYVVGVKWCGPPSGVYGHCELMYSGGGREFVTYPHDKFRPRKMDVEIRPSDESND